MRAGSCGQSERETTTAPRISPAAERRSRGIGPDMCFEIPGGITRRIGQKIPAAAPARPCIGSASLGGSQTHPLRCGPRARLQQRARPCRPPCESQTHRVVWFSSSSCRSGADLVPRPLRGAPNRCTASPKPNSGGEALLGPALRGTIAELAGASARRLVLGSCRSGARKANHALRACDSRRLRGVRPVRERGEALLARAG